jgi:hypothetical protein
VIPFYFLVEDQIYFLVEDQTGYRKKLEDRVLTRLRANEDSKFRLEVLQLCYDDSVYWCNNFGVTFDPRTKQRDLPFILFPKQIELIRWVEDLLEEDQDGAIEKSRDMGVSYTALIPIVLYRWLFHDFNAKVGSRKEELVDKTDDPDSLFWKIDYNLKKLPNWMLPRDFSWDKHRTYMRLSRPDNNNVITGESANEDFGRAGRNNLTILDEIGFWNWAKSSWEACGESTTTRLAISTPPKTGRASQFYKIVKGGRAKTFTFHYKDDPRKDIKWESQQRSKKTAEEFERELNISYSGSLEGTVYAVQFNLCKFKTLEYDPKLPLFTSWDFGLDATSIIWLQWDQKIDRWKLIDSYENHNMDIGFYTPFCTGIVKSEYKYTASDLKKIKEHDDWSPATHFGDPDVKKRSYQTKGTVSTRSVLQKSGIYVQSKPWAGRTHYDLRQKTLLFLKKLEVDENRNELFCDAIRNSRYPEQRETSQTTTPIQKPIHNWTSHFRTALEYMADNAPEIHIEKKKGADRKSIWER